MHHGRPSPRTSLLAPRLRENHAAGRHVREAVAHGDVGRGGVRERPGAAQGPVPGLLLLRPAGGHVPGPSSLQPGCGTTLTPPSPAERYSAEQPHGARDAGLHCAAGHPRRLPGLRPQEGGYRLSSQWPRPPRRGTRGSPPSGFPPLLPSTCPFLPIHYSPR